MKLERCDYAAKTSIKLCHGSHWSRNVRSAHHFQTIFRNKRGVVWSVLKIEHLIIPLFFKRVQSAMLNPAIPSVPNPNNPTVLET